VEWICLAHVKYECRILCVSTSTTGLTVRWSNPGGGESFRTRPERPREAASLRYSRYQVFLAGKVAGPWHLPPTLTYHRGWRKSRAILLLPLWVFVVCRTFVSNTRTVSGTYVLLLHSPVLLTAPSFPTELCPNQNVVMWPLVCTLISCTNGTTTLCTQQLWITEQARCVNVVTRCFALPMSVLYITVKGTRAKGEGVWNGRDKLR